MLEALEPRILLSGAPADPTTLHDHDAIEVGLLPAEIVCGLNDSWAPDQWDSTAQQPAAGDNSEPAGIDDPDGLVPDPDTLEPAPIQDEDQSAITAIGAPLNVTSSFGETCSEDATLADTSVYDGHSDDASGLVDLQLAANPPPDRAPDGADAGRLHLIEGQPLILAPGAPLIVGPADDLSGTGVIDGSVVNYGLFSPGNSPGIIEVENFTQADSATLLIEIAGRAGAGVDPAGHDQVQVASMASLDGTLEVRLLDGFAPQAGDAFVFMTFGSLSETLTDFIDFVGLDLGGGLFFRPVIDEAAGTYTLEVAPLPADLTVSVDAPKSNDDFFEFLAGKGSEAFFGFDGTLAVLGHALGGLNIRFGLSELGPLGVFINVSVPGGIVLEPHTGLAINDFSAGVEFFTSLPSIEDAHELRGSQFDLPTEMTAEEWLGQVKRQVVNQYKALRATPGLPGFLAAFTSPMTFTGGCKVFTIYTSKEVFNGEVLLRISTDGKFLIVGKLNFAADNISISGKLYADLSRIFAGDLTILFLADIPEQLQLLSIHGKFKMGFRNAAGEDVEFFALDELQAELRLEGQLQLVVLGNIGAAAGRFVLDLSGELSPLPQFWGVMTMEASFTEFEQFGIFIEGKATLQVNTTMYHKTETLTLAGLGPNNEDVTRTFELPPLSFLLEVIGSLRLRPPGLSSDLARLNGGFMIRLDPTRFDIYATAELSVGLGDNQIIFGEATGLIIVQTGLGGGIPGFAGYLNVSQSADIGLPNLGELFSASGSVSVMFNTTLREQTFEIPESFKSLLRPGEPTSIEIFAAAPGLDGQRDLTASPEIYFQATVQAELRLFQTITLTGFLQIEVAAALADGTARFSVVGAVSTEIEFLGSMSGMINMTMFIGAKTGVVGRVQLALNVNGIPGVELEGDFLLDINAIVNLGGGRLLQRKRQDLRRAVGR